MTTDDVHGPSVLDAKVRAAVEKFLNEVCDKPSRILNGLQDRPKPGQKEDARNAYLLLLHQIHQLRMVVEGTKPLRLVVSDGE